ncbi:MAG: hypothetical protein ACRBBQ_13435 [Cognatishimia sp.]
MQTIFRESHWTVGFILGAGVTLISLLSLDISIRQHVLSNWATLFVAFATIFAGFVGGFLALRSAQVQIHSQVKLENSRRSASLSAAKSTLPLALTDLLKIARRGAKYSLSIQGQEEDVEKLLNSISVSSEIVGFLKSVIQYSEAHNAERISALIRSYQVVFSRTESWLTEYHELIELDADLAVEWAVFYRQVESCYEFALGEQSDIPKEIQQWAFGSFFLVTLGVSHILFGQLSDAIKKANEKKLPKHFA